MADNTNVMRILEDAGVPYKYYTYESDGFIDGVSVAGKIGQSVERVFKTLVARGKSGAYYVFVVPVAQELDLKQAAKAVDEKSVEMIKVSEIINVTGYIRGGCSPIGMKKQYKTVIDSSCILLDTVIFSAGKIGYQVEVSPDDLVSITGASVADLVSG